MTDKNNNNDTDKLPINLTLFGYDDYFNFFAKLIDKNNLPNVLLLSGQKGIGKFTFANHLIFYLLSSVEEKTLYYKDKKIYQNNVTYNLLSNNIHPNFYLIESDIKNNIEIDKVRKLKLFLNKSAFGNNQKIVLINNIEFLNNSSANALLKILEDSLDNTLFVLIHDNSKKIIETIKSRSIEFNIFFNSMKKKEILNNLILQNNIIDVNIDELTSNFIYESPGNIINYLNNIFLDKNNSNQGNLNQIIYLIDQYNKIKDKNLLLFIKILIENFYHKLYLINDNYNIFKNKVTIINKINEMEKFNLDNKNIFFEIREILVNEKQR